jgi:hypothetical protein
MPSCVLCGSSRSTPFLDLGYTPLADGFLKPQDLGQPEVHYPLSVQRCDDCLHIQLGYFVPPDVLYCNDYPYESSVTQAGRRHFGSFANSVAERFGYPKGALAIDIGSNVGVLLKGFRESGYKVLGVEPAANIAAIAAKQGIQTISEFFSPELASRIVQDHGRAKVISATNVFAHIPNLHELMDGIEILLDDDGVFVVEAPHFVHLLDSLEYDTIYHEHLSYLSLLPLVPFFERHGMALFDVTQEDIHGGSIRMFIARQSVHSVTRNVTALMEVERSRDIHSLDNLRAFASRVAEHRDALLGLLLSLRREGKRIAGISAPAKGMTLLNYCKIGNNIIEFLTEKSQLKIGRHTPGAHLPIKPDSALCTEEIDFALILAWNFKDEIMSNLLNFKNQGGRFIIPIPAPLII